MYQETIDDTDPENIRVKTRYIMTSIDAPLVALPNGDSIKPYLQIFLLPNDEFVAYYNEYLHPQGNPNSFFPNGCKKITGKWSVPERNLLLPGIGHAESATVYGTQGMKIVITQKIISQELVNYSTNGSLGFGQQTMDQIFCW